MQHPFFPQHLHPSQNRGRAFISIHHHRPHGDLISSPVRIYLFTYLNNLHPSPLKIFSHLLPGEGLRL